MRPRATLLRSLIGVLVVFSGVSCSLPPPSSPSQVVCGGVSSDVGGCTQDRHPFVGETCEALAEEWGSVLDAAIVATLAGPDQIDGQGRSVRIRQALVVTTNDLTARLQGLGIAPDCDQPEFMRAAEPMFSAALREGVGAALYDGAPMATYDEWLQDVRNVVRSIDDGE